MGLDINGVRFLLYVRNLGVEFEQSMMIGRQSLDLTKGELQDNLKAFGYRTDDGSVDRIFDDNNGYAESLFKYLGANNIHSVDYSTYEAATHQYDLNQDIPPSIMDTYSVVLDGGSLEHIFNIPTAIKNCMKMLRVGGHYLGITPANNFMGHGFYQFSPEMYFSVFTHKNGFELIDLIAFEDIPGAAWYSVRRPSHTEERITLTNDQPVYMLVIAKKKSRQAIFETTPQQSDYISAWNKVHFNSHQRTSSNTKKTDRRVFLNWAKRNIPILLKYFLREAVQSYGFNPRFFSLMSPFPQKKDQKG